MPRQVIHERPTPPEKPARLRVADRPAVLLAIALMGGIFAHKVLPVASWGYLAVAGILIVAAIWKRRKPILSTAALAGAVGFAGVAAGQLHSFYYRADEIGRYAGPVRRLAQVELHFDQELRLVTAPPGGIPLPPKQVTVARATRILTNSGWQDCTGEVLIQIAEPHPRLSIGQTVRVIGMLERPQPAMNPGQFDWAAYYRQQRVLASLQIPHAAGVTILDEGRLGPADKLRREARRLLAEGFSDHHSLDHALLRALVLGDNDPELRDVQDQFKATGTSHHLAISGMHIAVIGGVVFLICRLLRVRPSWAWGAAVCTVIVYGTAALPSAPVIRSVALWVVVGGAMLLRRSVDLLQLLSVVLCGMLVWAPLDLFNAGFQLSFGTVFGLILLTERTARGFGWKGDPDPAAPPPRDAAERAGRVGAWMDSRLIIACAAGWVAYVISMPLVAVHFSQLNPWAILASIALAPIVLIALIGGAAKIVLTGLFPSGAGLFATLARWPVAGMRKSVGWLAQLPGGDVPLPQPAVGWVVAYFVLVGVVMIRWRLASVKWGGRGALASVTVLMLFMPHLAGVGRVPEKSLRLTLLQVGAGQCAVIEPPSRRITVIDAGSSSMSDVVRKCVAPFLRYQAVTDIDTVFVSHANTDHYSAVGELVRRWNVREVLADESFSKSVRHVPAGAAFLDSLATSQRPPRNVAAGQRLPLGTDSSIEVLWPPEGLPDGFSDNDSSLVLRLSHYGTRVLFTGDIEDAAMLALLEKPETLRADVLIAPHHGSSEATTARFLQAVGAKAILASNDRTLSGKQKRFDELAAGTPLLRTHRSGAVTLDIDENGDWTITPFVGELITGHGQRED